MFKNYKKQEIQKPEEPSHPILMQVDKSQSVPIESEFIPVELKWNPRFANNRYYQNEMGGRDTGSEDRDSISTNESCQKSMQSSNNGNQESIQQPQVQLPNAMENQQVLTLGRYVRIAKEAEPHKDESQKNIERINDSKAIQENYNKSFMRNQTFENQIKDRIHEFANDKYYHFIVQLILEEGPLGHKQWVFESVYEHRHEIIVDCFGYRIFTKCLEFSKEESESHFNAFVEFILDQEEHKQTPLFYDKYANYVVQRCMELFNEESLEQLLKLMKKNFSYIYDLPQNDEHTDLCFNQYGCLIVQKMIEIYNKHNEGNVKKILKQIINKLINRCIDLSTKQFSNYIVQQILEKGSSQHKQGVHNTILKEENFMKLSMDKFGSNVTERAVVFSNEEQRKKLWAFLEKNNNDYLLNLVNNSFANYVVQQIYNISPSVVQNEIFNMLSLWNKEGKLKEESGLHVFNFLQTQVKSSSGSLGHSSNNSNNNNKQGFKPQGNKQQKNPNFKNCKKYQQNYYQNNNRRHYKYFNNNDYQFDLFQQQQQFQEQYYQMMQNYQLQQQQLNYLQSCAFPPLQEQASEENNTSNKQYKENKKYQNIVYQEYKN